MSSAAGSSGRSGDGYDPDDNDTRNDNRGTRTPEDRRTVVDREKEEHGGIKIGSAFFGFLTATGVGVLLTALIAAAGTAVWVWALVVAILGGLAGMRCHRKVDKTGLGA